MAMTKKEQQDKIADLIMRGEEIYKKEYQRPTPRFPFAFADGPMYRAWMGEINTLNERYFRNHPLYSDIKSMYEKRNKETHAFEYMVSHLNALYADKEYWEEGTDVQQQEGAAVKEMDKTGIFISHSSKNADVAIMLRDFLIETGVPNEYIFCSSIKGNDVKHRISVEVKTALAQSCVNIAILSEEYKNSPYCVNEAGIIWFLDQTPAIVIGLPEITHKNMCGFINGDYIVRKLDLATDISEIYDIIEDQVHPKRPGYTVFTAASQKLIDRYNAYIASRPAASTQNEYSKETKDNLFFAVEKIVIEPNANKEKDRVEFSVIINNSSARTLSVYKKYLHYYKNGIEFHSEEVTRYEVHRREDALDSILVLEPVNAIVTLQPGHAESVGIIDEAEGLASADRIVFTCTADKTQYEFVVKE